MIKAEIGTHLRFYRTRRNLSQAEVARFLTYSQQTIAKWENSRATPDPSSLCKLADLYQVSLDELLNHRIVKETEAPYYTKKDVVEDWLSTIEFKEVFELKALNKSQIQHLSKQLILFIDLIKDSISPIDSEL